MAPPPKSAKMSKRIRQSMSNFGSISPVNDRSGTARYPGTGQNAAYLKAGAPQPRYPGNGQNAGNLKNAGAGWVSQGSAPSLSAANRPKNDKFLRPGLSKKKKKPEIEDPPLPPTDGTGNPPASPPPAPTPEPLYMNPDWSKVVGHYFTPTSLKDGGLVRGGGAATKGRGRGKIV